MFYFFKCILLLYSPNCLPFLFKSYKGFNSFCKFGQNILTKLTIPAKLLHCLAVVGGFIFCIASNRLCKDFTQTLLSFINIMFPIYWSSILKNWHFLGDIFNQFFLNAFKRSSNFAICAFLLGVKNNKLSIIASKYFLLCKQFKMVFIYISQIDGETFNPIGILWYKYDALPKYRSIPQYFCDFWDSCRDWKHPLNPTLT